MGIQNSLKALPEQPKARENQQEDNDPFERRRANTRERDTSHPNTDGNKREHPPE
jgi:hypothetical protein